MEVREKGQGAGLSGLLLWAVELCSFHGVGHKGPLAICGHRTRPSAPPIRTRPYKKGANPAPKPPPGVKPVPTARARGDKRPRAVPSTRHPPPVTTRLRGDRGCHRGTPNTSPCPAPPRLTYKTLPPAGPTCSCRWQWVPAAKRLPGRAGSSSHVPSRPHAAAAATAPARGDAAP